MVIFLPVIVLLFAVAVFSGNTSIVVLLPTLAVLAGGAVVVRIAMRDGQPGPGQTVRRLPTDHLRRQLFRAQHPHPSRARRDRDAGPE